MRRCSSRRAVCTCFIAECMAGAKRNAIPTCSRQAASCAVGRLIFTPNASITSAEPHFEVMLRLPCFATRTPAPATTKAVAVEMLNVPLASPPVPQVSTSASRPVPLVSEDGTSVKIEWDSGSANGFRKSHNLFDGFDLHVQRDQ